MNRHDMLKYDYVLNNSINEIIKTLERCFNKQINEKIINDFILKYNGIYIYDIVFNNDINKNVRYEKILKQKLLFYFLKYKIIIKEAFHKQILVVGNSQLALTSFFIINKINQNEIKDFYITLNEIQKQYKIKFEIINECILFKNQYDRNNFANTIIKY